MKLNQEVHSPLRAETIQGYIVDAVGDDKDMVLQMVDLFLESADNLYKEMESGLAAEDFVTVHRTAHSLKSSSRMFGTDSLTILCVEVEDLAGKKVGDTIRLLLPYVRAEVDWLGDELPAFCANLLK